MKAWTLKRMVMLTAIGMLVGLIVNNYYDMSNIMWWVMAFLLNIICINLVDHLNGERYE